MGGEDSSGSGGAEDALRQLAAAVPDGVALVCDERIDWANDRLVEMAGRRSVAELAGRMLVDLFKDTGSGLPDAAEPRAVECGLQRPDGQMRTAICRPAWPREGAGPSAWIVEDATHVRILERELLRMSQNLHRASRETASLRDRLRSEHAEREELLNVVSHELRTPLTVIRGYNRLLLAEEVGPLNAEQRRFLGESTKSCQRLNAFIENLLEASRETSGDEILEIGHGCLGPVIEGVIGMLRPLLEENELSVDVALEAAIPPARFDRMRLEQVLTNLMSNAIKVAPRGSAIRVGARLLDASESEAAAVRPLLEVAVSDEGPGVAPEDRERIFEPYVQAGEQSAAGGLGLGLAICRRLVHAHGGAIGVDERPGGGSRFAFTLPVAGAAPEAEE